MYKCLFYSRMNTESDGEDRKKAHQNFLSRSKFLAEATLAVRYYCIRKKYLKYNGS